MIIRNMIHFVKTEYDVLTKSITKLNLPLKVKIAVGFRRFRKGAPKAFTDVTLVRCEKLILGNTEIILGNLFLDQQSLF